MPRSCGCPSDESKWTEDIVKECKVDILEEYDEIGKKEEKLHHKLQSKYESYERKLYQARKNGDKSYARHCMRKQDQLTDEMKAIARWRAREQEKVWNIFKANHPNGTKGMW